MSDLSPALVALDKGLNLQTAKIAAPAGSVLDTLNYEQVDFQGQKRIDGFARYDGNLLPALDEWYEITLSATEGVVAGDLIAVTGGLVGVAVADEAALNIKVAVLNGTLIPEVGDSVFKLVNGANTGTATAVSVLTGINTGLTAAQHQAALLTYTQALRNRVGGLPGPVAGLHWFRDRLYAVASVTTISMEAATPILYPNDTLSNGAVTAKVLDSFVLGATRIVFLGGTSPELWSTPGVSLSRNGLDVGFVTAGFESTQDVASFFESRSEAQVLAEDGPNGPYNYGWRFVDHGWSLNFNNGLSLYGSLPSINQNIAGLGTEGPTSIAGDNGHFIVLSQKITLSNAPVQVNGWKSSTTPTSYILNSSDLTNTDGVFTYADAFVTWDGATGVVLAPGYNSGSLTEYPANNTVPLV